MNAVMLLRNCKDKFSILRMTVPRENRNVSITFSALHLGRFPINKQVTFLSFYAFFFFNQIFPFYQPIYELPLNSVINMWFLNSNCCRHDWKSKITMEIWWNSYFYQFKRNKMLQRLNEIKNIALSSPIQKIVERKPWSWAPAEWTTHVV